MKPDNAGGGKGPQFRTNATSSEGQQIAQPINSEKCSETAGTRIVTYADDLVILCRRGNAEEALLRVREIMGKLKLTVNEEKTRICKISEGKFDFC